MSRYKFPGYTVFLRDAAQRIGRPEAEGPARRIATLGALGNLCAQASDADPADVPGIMAKAAEFRDQLQAAYVAAELMTFDVHRAFGLHADHGPEDRPARPARARPPKEKLN